MCMYIFVLIYTSYKIFFKSQVLRKDKKELPGRSKRN